MTNIKNINGYDIKDAVARENIATIDNQLNNETTGLEKKVNNLQTEVTGIESDFNFTDTGTATISESYGTLSPSSYLNYAVNENGTIGKLYGFLRVTNAESIADDYVQIIAQTPFRPTENFLVNGYGIACVYEGTIGNITFEGMQPIEAEFKTDGTVEFTMANNSNIVFRAIYLPAIIIFAKNFGDDSPFPVLNNNLRGSQPIYKW